MKLLSVDTSSDVCSVAILENAKLIKELHKTDSKTHSENLMPLIDSLLKEFSFTLDDINAIACSIGPGSFTGIRIGIASCKAMAEVKNIPLIGVTSLETLAYLEDNSNKNIASIIDAKNHQAYAGIFSPNHLLLEDYMADDIPTIVSRLSKYTPLTFVGNGSIIYKELLQSEFPQANFSGCFVQSAYALGKCAYSKWKAGQTLTPDTLLPLYLRKSQAERMKQNNGTAN